MKSTMAKGILAYLIGVVAVCVLVTIAYLVPAKVKTDKPDQNTWMPVKILDADLAKIQTLKRNGDTYSRFAKPDGTWGITAVRQSGGIWVIPCQEIGPVGGRQ